MPLRMTTTLAASLLVLSTSAANAAPSAKFTAVVDKVKFSTAATRDATGETATSAMDTVVATLKMPSRKELLVQISAQIAIDTETQVKGKNGGGGSATAAGSAAVSVEACHVDTGECTPAEPGAIIFSAREQELTAVLGGVIESCTDGDLDGVIDISDDCVVTNEEIGLLLSTTAAHHYNFLVPNLDAGTYNIIATFDADAAAAVSNEGDQDDGTSNYANASIIVGPTVTVVEEVRATNNPDGVVIIE